jgi:hypothetical protein
LFTLGHGLPRFLTAHRRNADEVRSPTAPQRDHDPVDHYANAFTIDPGRCFRMVQLPGVGHPMHCVEPVAWHGQPYNGHCA